MKQITTLISLIFLAFILVSCANGRYPYPKSDLGKETWRSKVDTNPNVWAMKADNWFTSGGPTRAKEENDSASYRQAISRTSVRVTNFIGIRAVGNFQVQIAGDRDRNTLTIEGPNEAVRAIAVNVTNNVLCLEQAKKAPANMNQVIVHITMRHLEYLLHDGLGSVEGVRLDANHLRIDASGCGNIFLVGRLDVKSIISRGPGTVNVFTTCANGTEIETYGSGGVNLSAKGYVSLRSIKHKGSGDINVIGANGGNLVVKAEGKGKIGISGHVNVREIRASGKTCVFIASSDSVAPCIYVYDDARVGIDGRASVFNGYTTRTSRLLARNLWVGTSSVQAYGQSHMNVIATERIFAAANDYSTIYYYGNPNIMTALKRGDGAIIYMGMPRSTEDMIVPKPKFQHGRPHKVTYNRQPAIKMGQNNIGNPGMYA